MRKFGIPEAILRVMNSMYNGLEKCTKLGKSLGQNHHNKNGYGQGDPLSLLPALTFVSVQFVMIHFYWPQLQTGAVIDDRSLTGRAEQLVEAHVAMRDFDQAAGQAIEPDKTAFAATDTATKEYILKPVLDGVTPELKSHFVLVGDVISTAFTKNCKYADKRLREAMATTARILSLPLSRAMAKHAVCTSVIPKMTYGTQWNLPSSAAVKSIRSRILQAIWGTNNKMRCAEIVLSVLHDATRVEPTFACATRSLLVARRMVLKSRERYDKLIQAFRKAIERGTHDETLGPAHGLARAAELLDITISYCDEHLWLHCPTGTVLPLDIPNKTVLQEVARESAEHVILQHLEERANKTGLTQSDRGNSYARKDMADISPLVDMSATRALANKKHKTDAHDNLEAGKQLKDAKTLESLARTAKLLPEEARTLQTIISGSIRTPSRLWCAKLTDNGRCDDPRCDNCPATAEHLFWECPKYHSTRQQYLALVDDFLERTQPKAPARAKMRNDLMRRQCFKSCGICVGDDEARKITDSKPRIDGELTYDDNKLVFAEEGVDPWLHYRRVYTDGSACGTESRGTARAAWAVYYGEGSPHNTSMPLVGMACSSYRAEVRALVHVVLRAAVPTEIICDCKGATTLFNQIINGENVDLDNLADGDLWKIIAQYRPTNPSFFRCRWMPSHLDEEKNRSKKEKAIREGLLKEGDLEANGKADEMAKAALATTYLPTKVVRDLDARRQLTVVVQMMMTHIWKEIRDADGTTKEQDISEADRLEAHQL